MSCDHRVRLRVAFLSAAFALAAFAYAESGDARPAIGVTYTASDSRALASGERDPRMAYREAIEANGGRVVPVSQTLTPEERARAMDSLDGILLPGGIDVDPRFYRETAHEKIEKTDADLDETDFALLEYADEHGLPVLGICRGLQVMNVYGNGSLYQDIPSEFEGTRAVTHRNPKDSKEGARHVILIEADSILRALLGVDRIVANSSHHQAVRALAPGFRVTARSEDGSVEAVEGPGPRFVVGVQFHPERMRGEDPRFDAIFERFVEEAERAHRERTGCGTERRQTR